METRSFPDALKAILKQRGWSQARLARELDMSEDWVSKSRRGLRDPSIGRVIQLLSGVGWEVVIRPKSPKREKSDPVKRREFHGRVVKLAAGSAAVKATGITFVPSARVPIFRNHEYVTALVDHVTHMRNENGAARLISTVAGYVERVGITDVVKGRDRKLQDAAARLLRVQAFTLYDADRMNHAEDVAKSALALAKASQNPAAQALMYITLSQIATYAGTGDRGRYYAEQGLKIPGVNDGYRAELHKRKMRALAILPNQVRATLAAYADIRNLDQRSFDFFDALGPGLSLNVGVALSDLGRHQAAIEAFRESANLFGGSSPHYHAQSLIGEITSLLHARMPEVAADRMLVLAHVLPLISSVRDQKEAGAILDASARWMNVPAVREARDQLREAIRPAR